MSSCHFCKRTFKTEAARDQHARDKHGIEITGPISRGPESTVDRLNGAPHETPEGSGARMREPECCGTDFLLRLALPDNVWWCSRCGSLHSEVEGHWKKFTPDQSQKAAAKRFYSGSHVFKTYIPGWEKPSTHGHWAHCGNSSQLLKFEPLVHGW